MPPPLSTLREDGSEPAAAPDKDNDPRSARWIPKTAFLAAVLQATALGLGWRMLAVCLALVHAGCCLIVLMLQQLWASPAIGKALSSLGPQGLTPQTMFQLGSVQMEMGSARHLYALISFMAADLFAGIVHATSERFVWECLYDFCSAGAAVLLLRAAWCDGKAVSRPLRAACWCIAFLGATLIVDPEHALDLTSLEPALAGHILRAAKVYGTSAVLARCTAALLSDLLAHGTHLALSSEGGRLTIQLLGLALLTAPMVAEAAPAARALLPTLAPCLSRLGITCLTFSTWLLEHRALAEDAAEALDELPDTDPRAAHRAAMARRRAAQGAVPVAAPLLMDSAAGGVQGLTWSEQALQTDTDGDRAHEFWTAESSGLFRRDVS
uniref:Uncharacterized protein n=1 Tax=Coccolithus braarudii TaxID=221442 RepID=A0A7S0LT60_9EUKA|mmetsp:Transcript_53047/g.113391  ORF Transcript_53047/g.113391 Transcript_53047/m.113391 type:complete len:382 (+) Transcript_53047:206-1351(+)|eukprot:CAMPEP_0183339146 /NCGR_PEP_ID=MMETSP0164_2-20130417/6178_1 /TAXON_ID=221442 /ORGANISM="Coccolithus pelagicus ssp braarudi, Strain PLY182g" /LENGTH=381 /DNA_ID=CAMNT_0025509101 /DNA_START=206 /DNA_END=1351 /DNA_ORIENTATION=-